MRIKLDWYNKFLFIACIVSSILVTYLISELAEAIRGG